MATNTNQAPLNLGYLSILRETNGFLGGYLVTNHWGRPLEFRISTAVQPNRVQQILYADTLSSYVCSDVIGKTLVEKTSTPVQLLLTDQPHALDLRHRVECPVLWLVPSDDPQAEELASGPCCVRPPRGVMGPLVCHSRFPQDVESARELLATADGMLDLSEPFLRIRDAVSEARKLGVSGRAAA